MELIEHLEITPFHKMGNGYNIPDTQLGKIYRRIIMEGTAHWIFYENSVRNTSEFIDFLKRKEHSVYFVKFTDEDVGFFWLTKFVQKAVFINYCFYKNFWGKKSLQVSRSCLDYILHKKNDRGNYMIDVLLGLTPANNKLAISYLKKNGMTVIGRIPGLINDYHRNMIVDGLISYKTRENSRKRIADVFHPFSKP